MSAAQFVRIDRARCKRCGDKDALRIRGRDYPLPVTLDMDVVERTPWRCGCRQPVTLEVEVVQ